MERPPGITLPWRALLPRADPGQSVWVRKGNTGSLERQAPPKRGGTRLRRIRVTLASNQGRIRCAGLDERATEDEERKTRWLGSSPGIARGQKDTEAPQRRGVPACYTIDHMKIYGAEGGYRGKSS